VGVRCHCLSSSARDVLWPWRLRQLIAAGKFDVVHFHSPLVAAMGRLATLTIRRASRPARITTEHNSWATYSAPTRWLNRLTSALDTRTFAVSSEAAASMRGRARSRATVLRHGIDVDGTAGRTSERTAARSELGLHADHFVVGTVANYREQKDYPTLLEAARQISHEVPAFRLVAVGQGPLAAEVEATRTGLGLGESVILTGYRADAIRVMTAFDVFTLSSRYEGLPVALMEALALGLPVASTAVGGVAETLTDEVDALLVPPGDPTALAAAWRRICDDAPLRARLCEGSRAQAAQFDIRRTVAVLEEAYDDAVDAIPGRRDSGRP
jgi:glycosyltransferase involved in cell wall biosynthesis